MSSFGSRPGPPPIEGLFSLKVDNISYQTTQSDIRRLFDRYGEIGDIHIPRDRHTKQSKGFAFVRYYSKRDADYAMDRVDGRWVDGREIRVAMARYERPIDERGHDRDRGYRKRSRSRTRSPVRRRRRSRSRDGHRSRTRSPRSRSRTHSRSRSRSHSPSRSPNHNGTGGKADGSKSPSRSP